MITMTAVGEYFSVNLLYDISQLLYNYCSSYFSDLTDTDEYYTCSDEENESVYDDSSVLSENPDVHYTIEISDTLPIGSTIEDIQTMNGTIKRVVSFLNSQDDVNVDNIETILQRARLANIPSQYLGEIYRDCVHQPKINSSIQDEKSRVYDVDKESVHSESINSIACSSSLSQSTRHNILKQNAADASQNSNGCIEAEDNLNDFFPIGSTLPELKSLNSKVVKCHELLQILHPELNNIGDVLYEARKAGVDRKTFHLIFEDKLITNFPQQYQHRSHYY